MGSTSRAAAKLLFPNVIHPIFFPRRCVSPNASPYCILGKVIARGPDYILPAAVSLFSELRSNILRRLELLQMMPGKIPFVAEGCTRL